MQKRVNRKGLLVTFIIVIVCVVSLTIVYSALSSVLNISGRTTLEGGSFHISVNTFDEEKVIRKLYNTETFYTYDGKNGLTKGDGEILNYGTIDGSKIKDFKFSLTKPGDIVSLFYKVTNDGTIPMIYKDVVFNDVTISGMIDNNIINYFNIGGHSFLIIDDVKEDFVLDDVLCPGDSFYLRIYIEFKSAADFVLDESVMFGNLGGEMFFEQVDRTVCN